MEPSGYRLSHVVLETENIERSIAFYTHALRMKGSGETDEGFALHHPIHSMEPSSEDSLDLQ